MALSAPTNLELSLTGPNYSNVKLEWVEPAINAVSVIGYSIEISDNGQNWRYLIGNTNSKLTSYIDNSMFNSKRRYYRVKAISTSEISIYSNTGFIRIPKLPKTVTKISISNNSSDSITLTWRYGADVNTSHYEVRQTQGAHNITTYLTQDSVLDIINLHPDTRYKYEIRVKSKYGYSEWSDVINGRTLRVPYAPVVRNKAEYIKGNSALTWTYNLFKEVFKFSIQVGNDGVNSVCGYSIHDSIGNMNHSINLPSFLFVDNISPILTSFTIDGHTLTIDADSADWQLDLSDYYFRLCAGSTVLDTFSVSDSDQEFKRHTVTSKLQLLNYDGGFDIADCLNRVLDVYIYDVNPALTGNNSVPDIIDYQIEGSYNNVNWHVLDSNIDSYSYEIYHTNPPLTNVRVAARNSQGLGDYG